MPYTGSAYINAYRAKRRAWALAELGGHCVRCGTTVDLEFDHIDPGTKTAKISSLWTAARDVFEAEVRKCQLLCGACHDEKSLENGENCTAKPAEHGGLTMYLAHGCRCDACSANYSRWKRGYRLRQKGSSVTSLSGESTAL